jgi:hypothetical protein
MKFYVNFEGWCEVEAKDKKEAQEELEFLFENLPGIGDVEIWTEEDTEDD